MCSLFNKISCSFTFGYHLNKSIDLWVEKFGGKARGTRSERAAEKPEDSPLCLVPCKVGGASEILSEMDSICI